MKKAERPVIKVTINLFEGQMQSLQEHYPDVGGSAIIRRLIDAYLKQIEGAGGDLNANVEIKI